MRKLLFAAAVVASVLSFVPASPSAQQRDPKLLVVVAVDQMRGDYIDRYQGQWSGGLKRLVTEGAWFRQADYPYSNTVTCAGHASISTGTVPTVHGMILNRWWDRSSRKPVDCTDDETQRLISYGSPVAGTGQSAARLLVPTLSDELRLQQPRTPRIVSVSLKARSAIMLAGHRPDAVTWLDQQTGEWVTSTAFSRAPVPFIADYIRAHPVRSEIGRTWDRALPKERYLYDDSPIGGLHPKLEMLTFPHVIGEQNDSVNGSFADAWESSPFSDAYLAGLAAAAIDALKLGRGPGTDFLGISFSALDKVGHDFGPESHEVQDVLIRLDRELGTLLDKLDRDVGRDSYTLALSADHGVAPAPERLNALGFDAGRISVAQVRGVIDEALARVLGAGKYVALIEHTDIYFLPGVYERLAQHPRAMATVMKAIRDVPGIWRVYRKESLIAGGNDADPTTRAASRSYFEGRSGDMVMLPRPYWMFTADTTTHGTGHRYDTRVPVILFGHGIRAGQYLQPAAPIDIAPTLALLASVTLSDPMGRVLVEALDTQSLTPNSQLPNPNATARD